MANLSKTTKNHDEIQRWAEERGGKPSHVKSTSSEDEVGILRIDFPGFSGEGSLEEIPWEDFFEKFDAQNLALVYQEETADGERSNFNKLISGDSVETTDDEGKGKSTAGKTTAKGAAKKAAPAKKEPAKSSAKGGKNLGTQPAKKSPTKTAAKKSAPPKKAASAKKTAPLAKKSAASAKKGAPLKKSAPAKKVSAKQVPAKKIPAKKVAAKKTVSKASSKRSR